MSSGPKNTALAASTKQPGSLCLRFFCLAQSQTRLLHVGAWHFGRPVFEPLLRAVQGVSFECSCDTVYKGFVLWNRCELHRGHVFSHSNLRRIYKNVPYHSLWNAAARPCRKQDLQALRWPAFRRYTFLWPLRWVLLAESLVSRFPRQRWLVYWKLINNNVTKRSCVGRKHKIVEYRTR